MNKKEKTIGIYKITSPSGRIYIGQSIDINRRFYDYNRLRRCDEQQKLYNSFLKYGIENHIFEIIHECSEEELNYWEIHYGKLFNVTGENGLNIRECGGAHGSHSVETKKKMSEAQSGEKHPMFGKNRTEESKIKQSKSVSGENNPMFGKKFTEESKLKLSQSKKGYCSGENNPFYGKKHTQESKIKNSEAHKRENLKKETIEKKSGKNHHYYGKKINPEIIAKREATRILLRQERRTMIF